MPIEIHCGHCQQLLSVPDELAGQVVQCPNCQQASQMPGDASGATVAVPAAAVEAPAPPAGTRNGAAGRLKKASPLPLIAVGLVSVIVGGAAVYVVLQALDGAAAKQPPTQTAGGPDGGGDGGGDGGDGANGRDTTNEPGPTPGIRPGTEPTGVTDPTQEPDPGTTAEPGTTPDPDNPDDGTGSSGTGDPSGGFFGIGEAPFAGQGGDTPDSGGNTGTGTDPRIDNNPDGPGDPGDPGTPDGATDSTDPGDGVDPDPGLDTSTSPDPVIEPNAPSAFNAWHDGAAYPTALRIDLGEAESARRAALQRIGSAVRAAWRTDSPDDDTALAAQLVSDIDLDTPDGWGTAAAAYDVLAGGLGFANGGERVIWPRLSEGLERDDWIYIHAVRLQAVSERLGDAPVNEQIELLPIVRTHMDHVARGLIRVGRADLAADLFRRLQTRLSDIDRHASIAARAWSETAQAAMSAGHRVERYLEADNLADAAPLLAFYMDQPELLARLLGGADASTLAAWSWLLPDASPAAAAAGYAQALSQLPDPAQPVVHARAIECALIALRDPATNDADRTTATEVLGEIGALNPAWVVNGRDFQQVSDRVNAAVICPTCGGDGEVVRRVQTGRTAGTLSRPVYEDRVLPCDEEDFDHGRRIGVSYPALAQLFTRAAASVRPFAARVGYEEMIFESLERLRGFNNIDSPGSVDERDFSQAMSLQNRAVGSPVTLIADSVEPMPDGGVVVRVGEIETRAYAPAGVALSGHGACWMVGVLSPDPYNPDNDTPVLLDAQAFDLGDWSTPVHQEDNWEERMRQEEERRREQERLAEEERRNNEEERRRRGRRD